MKALATLVLLVMATASSGCADTRVVHQALQQGGFWMAQVPPGSFVRYQGEAVPVGKDGLVGVGFARDAKPQARIEVCVPGGRCDEFRLQVAGRAYETQQVRGVPAKTVNPDKMELARIEDDNRAIKVARSKQSDLSAFAGIFRVPVNGQETGLFGSRRMYNGEERSWHRGYDLAAPVGTPVVAPAEGIVRLVRNTFMTGNLVLLDHGHGFNTVYAHMNSTAVKVGQHVQAGDALGTVGKTGRATGPHLHWGFFWNQVPLDARLLLTR